LNEHEYLTCIAMYQINYIIIRMDMNSLHTLIGIKLAMITLEYTCVSYMPWYGLFIYNDLEVEGEMMDTWLL